MVEEGGERWATQSKGGGGARREGGRASGRAGGRAGGGEDGGKGAESALKLVVKADRAALLATDPRIYPLYAG